MMIAFFYLAFLAVTNGCGTPDHTKPQLRITVADISNAGTDVAAGIHVRVLYGTGMRDAQWSDWQDLDTPDCDDLDRGQTDYFDLDLGGSTDPWLAIAFFGTTTDGLVIDSLNYWDGTQPQALNRFCSLIAGPSKSDLCFIDAQYDDMCANIVTNDPSYDSFWIDSDRSGCAAASINLAGSRIIGSEFIISDPGTPSNPSSLSHSSKALVSRHKAPIKAQTSCGTRDDTKPQLRITVADLANAGTDVASQIFVRVLYGKRLGRAQWSDWHDLDTAGCDDLDRGQTDYFDLTLDCYDSTAPWLAIAFYGTTTDGLIIDSLSFWNGTGPQEVDRFCGLVQGPSKGDMCFYDAQDDDDDLCGSRVTNDPSYGSFWIDSDRSGCAAASINLAGTNAGTGFFISDPGTPSNPSLSYVPYEYQVRAQSRSQKSQLNKDGMILSAYPEAASANYWIYQIMFIAALSVICFACGYYYHRKRHVDDVYKPLPDVI